VRVDLHRLGVGRHTVKVEVRTRGGKRVTIVRRVRLCGSASPAVRTPATPLAWTARSSLLGARMSTHAAHSRAVQALLLCRPPV
jgi:hypothetical protein